MVLGYSRRSLARLAASSLLMLCMYAPAGTLATRVSGMGVAPVQLALTTAAPGARFMPGQPVLALFTMHAAAAETYTYTRTETLTDYFGAVTSLLTDTVTLAPGAVARAILRPAITRLGYFALAVSLTPSAAGATPVTNAQPIVATLPLAVMQPAQPAFDLSSPFGVSGTLTGAADDQAAGAAAMAAAGIAWDREEFNWSAIEPRLGSAGYDWTRTDAAVIADHAVGIDVLGLLDSWGGLPAPDIRTAVPGAYRQSTVTGCGHAPACAYTPEGDARFAAFAAAVVDRYRAGGVLAQQQGWTEGYGIEDWEVWNEPFNRAFWRQDLIDYAARFVVLLQDASRAIHGADPAARVMYDHSGVAIDGPVAAAGSPYDIVSVHSYSGGLDPDTAFGAVSLGPGGQGTAPTAIHGLVAGGRPVWITETGYPTDGLVTPRRQAEYLVRSYVDFLAAGVAKDFWFKLREDPGGTGEARFYGILDGAGRPKPAYLALATLTRHLLGAVFVAAPALGSAVHAAVFAAPGGAYVTVLWTTGDQGAITLPTGAGQFFAADLMDNPIGASQSGHVTAPLSPDPVFLTTRGLSLPALLDALRQAPISGIDPVGVAVSQAPGLANGLPDLKVTVSARTNVPISGTVTPALPDGWLAAERAAPFPTLAPGAAATVTFHLLRVVDHPGDLLTATAATPSGLAGAGSAPVTDFALTYGHPAIDGTLATWGGAAEADLTDPRPDQVVGIPDWTPANLSARIYTMWDEQAFYLAADVRDEHFDLAPAGYNMYQGDSMQFGWATDPPLYGHRYNLTVGLTTQGAANFQYNLLGPWSDVREAILPDPTTGDLIYTLAIPWSRLGGYAPRVGQQIAFDLIVNQNEQHARIGWIQFSPGVGIGFHPRLYPLWTLIGGKPVAGLRIGGRYAPPAGLVRFSLHSPDAQVLIHDGGMRRLTLVVNGTPVTVISGTLPGQIAPFGTSALDLSRFPRTGDNSIEARGAGGAASAAVVSIFR